MDGASVRIHNLLENLARRHEVRLFWQPRIGNRDQRADGGYQRIAHASPVAATMTEVGWRSWISAPVLAGAALRATRPPALTELIRWADLIMVEFPWQFEYCRRRRAGTPLVLAGHNVEAEKFNSWGDAAGARLTRRPWLRYIERREHAACQGADLVIVVKEGDREELVRRYGVDPRRVVVVPNGADTRRYRPAEPDRRSKAKRELGLPERPVAIYAGTAQPPNQAGLSWVRRLARRASDLSFVVVGRVGGRPGMRENLITTGPVLDLRPWLEAADLALCPIEHGGGTKIKLLEALAAGLPTIAFPPSVDGIAARSEEHLLVCEPNEEAVVESLERLRREPALAAGLAQRARTLATAEHDWERLGDRLEGALARLIEGPIGCERPRDPAEGEGQGSGQKERPRA